MPVVIFTIAGILVSLLTYDESRPLAVICGFVLMILGFGLELMIRSTLITKAHFPNFVSTKRLMIVDDHKLIMDGIFGYIRHPLYLGRIVANFGIAIFFSSYWGVLLMAFAALGFLIRMRIEEEMLIDEFGDAYRDYQKRTKKLIPFVY